MYINALRVKCELNHEYQQKSDPIKCEWTGTLGDHENNNCPLLEVECPDCNESMKIEINLQ